MQTVYEDMSWIQKIRRCTQTHTHKTAGTYTQTNTKGCQTLSYVRKAASPSLWWFQWGEESFCQPKCAALSVGCLTNRSHSIPLNSSSSVPLLLYPMAQKTKAFLLCVHVCVRLCARVTQQKCKRVMYKAIYIYIMYI